MSGSAMGALGILAMLVLLAMRMPVGFAMTAVGLAGTVAVYGGNWGPALGNLALVPYAQASSFLFTTIPMFILMGQFAYRSGASRELFEAARKWMGHWPGGLGVATIGACAGFSAASGSSVATAAALGTITIPEMRKSGVNVRMATGVVAAGGTLGILIPPSLGMIVYALVTDQSIGRLLMAGLLPGLMLAVLFIITVAIWATISPKAAPRGPRYTIRQRLEALSGCSAFRCCS